MDESFKDPNNIKTDDIKELKLLLSQSLKRLSIEEDRWKQEANRADQFETKYKLTDELHKKTQCELDAMTIDRNKLSDLSNKLKVSIFF